MTQKIHSILILYLFMLTRCLQHSETISSASAPDLAPADTSTPPPLVVIPTTNETEFKFLNTKNYIAAEKYGVTEANNVYTLQTDTSFSCSTGPTSYYLHQMRAVTVGSTERLLLAEKRGRLHTFPLHPTATLTCPETLDVMSAAPVSVSFDVHRTMGVYLGPFLTNSYKTLQFKFRLLNLATTPYTLGQEISSLSSTAVKALCMDFSRTLATLASLGTDGRSVVVFLPNRFNGVTTYHGSIDGTLTETNISTDTPLAAAVGCFRMTRIGVSDPLSTTTTVTLAVACADDGTGKPAVYMVQVPVVEGVPQTLKVTASTYLDLSTPSEFCDGGISYLDGSLVVNTINHVYNYVLSDPESENTNITLRSWFENKTIVMSNIAHLTPDVAVVSGWEANNMGTAVLNLADGSVIQKLPINTGSTTTVRKLSTHYNVIESILRLSDTSFLTAGGFKDVLRWESCAGLGFDYAVTVRNTSNSNAPSVTCGCPAGKVCLLGTAYDTCPLNTTAVGQECHANDPYYLDRPTLSVKYCPAGHKCVGGVKTPCEVDTYQPSAGQTECYTCPAHSTASTDHTTCAVEDGYYISGGTLATNDATTDICPKGHKCKNGEKTECTGANYQSAVGQSTCQTVTTGYYTTPEGAAARTGQTECQAGYKCVAGEKTECTGAEYQSVVGQSECLTCDAGHYVIPEDASAHTGQVKCQTGYKCEAGSRTACTGANYQPDEGASTCEPVTTGYYTTPEGATARTGQTECPAGHKCVGGVKTACEGKTYQPSAGAISCFNCPADSTATSNHHSCTITDGYYISTGSLAAGDAFTIECPAGHKCKGGVKTECVNGSTTREYQDQDARAECKACSDADNYQYLVDATSTTCDYCPSTEYHTSTGCQPCNALTGANYCQTKTDAHDVQFKVISTCLPDQWRVNPYQCRYCQSDEICHGDGTRTWKFKATMDPETISGKMLIAVIVVSLVILSALAFWLAYYLRHKGLSRRSAGANAKVEAEGVEMIQI